MRSGTGWCSPTRRWPRSVRPTKCSTSSSRRCASRSSTSVVGRRASSRPERAMGVTLKRPPPRQALPLRVVGEPTPERPGPGPMPDALLRALELTIGRRVEGLLQGEHRSRLLGRGTELAQVRPYVPGDDVRLIDWNVTARTGEPHIRVHLAERV